MHEHLTKMVYFKSSTILTLRENVKYEAIIT